MSGWEQNFAFEEVDASQQPISQQQAQLLEFVQDHETKLREIEDAINDGVAEVCDHPDDPIAMHLQPPEKVDVQDLVTSETELFNKVLTVMAVLCDEVNELKTIAESTFYPTLCMFGQAPMGDESEVKDGDEELQMGRMLPFFQDLSNFVDRCYSITVNLVHQLASLYHGQQRLWNTTYKFVHLLPAFQALASLLGVLVTLDTVVADNEAISGNAGAWVRYKRMMQFVRREPSRFNVDESQVAKFERLLVSLDQSIMAGAMLQTCVEQDFESSPDAESPLVVSVRSNRVFLEECALCIKLLFERTAAAASSEAQTTERGDLVGIFGLYALYRRLCPNNIQPDAKFYRQLWEVQKVVPMVTLCHKICWYPSDFLLQHAPLPVKKLVPKDVDAFRRAFVNKLDEDLPTHLRNFMFKLSGWLVQMETHMQANIRAEGSPATLLWKRSQLMQEGLVLAHRLQILVQTCMHLHLSLEVGIRLQVLRPILSAVEMLKAIEFAFARKGSVIAETIPHVVQNLRMSLGNLFRPLKIKLEASKKVDDTKLDMIAALCVLENTLRSSDSMSPTRLTVVELALHVVLMSNMVKDDEAAKARKLVQGMRQLSNIRAFVRQACDCSFLYWSPEVFATAVDDAYATPESATRLQYLVSGMSDARLLLEAAHHEADNSVFLRGFEDFIVQDLEEHLVQPLCRAVENDLRVHVHSVHLDHMAAPNPKREESKVLSNFFVLKPLRIFGRRVDVRARVTRYLETTFYNLTTVALHDWKTYGEMRNLAREKYGLELAENHLPMGSLDTSLDVLQIMRNISLFCQKFNYNLNQQFFVERRSDKGSRHLNTINIQSISSSIRTHGIGIMNTTVNFTYQFLAQKFHIFSEFLFDEYIKSHLAREKRWFKVNRHELDNKYSYEHALAFCQDIRKLGVTEDGKSFLDQFRQLVTEIGNALGYVRLVANGGMFYCAEAVKFVPDLKNILNFSAACGAGQPAQDEDEADVVGANLSPETQAAAANLDDVISVLARNFSEGSDYFKVLVSVFRNVMHNDSASHLQNFYQIVPSLMINYVENIILAKDLMAKSNRRANEAYFTDDGFSIGVAYILAILDQNAKFNSLHWFDTITDKYNADARDLRQQQQAQQRGGSGGGSSSRSRRQQSAEDEVHTLKLSAKRIEAHVREFELLRYSFSGACIFFRDTDARVEAPSASDAAASAGDAGAGAGAEAGGEAAATD